MKNDVKYVSVLAAILMAWVGFYKCVEPASAQSMTSPISVFQAPAQIAPTQGGIKGQLQFYANETKPTSMSVTVSAMKMDYESGRVVPDPTSRRQFGPCPKGVSIDCVRSNWTYAIAETSLPPTKDYYGYGEYDVRAEATGFYHFLANVVRVNVVSGVFIDAPAVPMYEMGMKIQGPYMYWQPDGTLFVGMWVRSGGGNMSVNIAHNFTGTGWTAVDTKYPTLVFPGQITEEWQWIGQAFYPPADTGTSNYGGSLSDEVQITATWNNEYVFAQTKKASLVLKQPVQVWGNGGH
jgi:hypothetical protein